MKTTNTSTSGDDMKKKIAIGVMCAFFIIPIFATIYGLIMHYEVAQSAAAILILAGTFGWAVEEVTK